MLGSTDPPLLAACGSFSFFLEWKARMSWRVGGNIGAEIIWIGLGARLRVYVARQSGWVG